MSFPSRLVVVHDARARPRPVDDLVRLALDELGAGPGDSHVRHHCPSCGSNDHGRPWLDGLTSNRQLHLSVSRCAGRSVVAVSEAGPVGVDVERAGSARPRDLDRVLGAGPGDATRRWVRTEAWLKASGHGFARATGTETVSGPAWRGDLDLGAGFEAAAAVMTTAATDPELTIIQAGAAAPSR